MLAPYNILILTTLAVTEENPLGSRVAVVISVAGVVAKREIHPNETVVVKSVMNTMQILSERRRVNSRMIHERFMTPDV